MIVREMFAEDVERKISGVVKVGETDSVEQEIREYVVTKELKRHFAAFFNYYNKSFNEPTDDVGVWISGFFGSGKSHLLKILSYLLEDKKIGATTTVEAFRQKFADDPGTFMLVDQATKAPTETILFNIAAKSPDNPKESSVLSSFSKTFYDHLGYKGNDLKAVELEKYLDQEEKKEDFRRAIEKHSGGKPWEIIRKSFGLKRKVIVPALVDSLELEQKDAEKWFNDLTETKQFSIDQFVDDVKTYVDSKSNDFRLLFMIDEVGQFVGSSTDKLLNLQTIFEELGSKCKGKVWVVCTGQEALDKVIKVREAAFSKIQDRFRLRLSLSSSSVGEVIQKRILTKKSDVGKKLEKVYDKHESELRNLFSFQGARSDVKGFESDAEFAACFPFVPYQFLVVKNVFVEIRNHAIKGANMSSGERSMLSGFQEAVKSVLRRDENALVPFYCFFESLYSFLDVDVRNVFERCEQAASAHAGLEPGDLNLLKLLYLLRYIDDVPSNKENLTILMADAIDVDKIKLREQVAASLQRLQDENYVGQNDEIYVFLTNEEQDVRRGIRDTALETADVVAEIAKLIFGNIYANKKYRDKNETDFEFDKFVDNSSYSTSTNVMRLRFMTDLVDDTPASGTLIAESSKNQALVVFSDLPFYDDLVFFMKTRKYLQKIDRNKLSTVGIKIVDGAQVEASHRLKDAQTKLEQAIVDAEFYVMGEKLDLCEGTVKDKIERALQYLVDHVYKKLSLVVKKAKDDEDVRAALKGQTTTFDEVQGANSEAVAEIEEFLSRQNMKKLQTTMADVQAFFRKEPYGWSEVDVAALVASLFAQNKITLKRSGAPVRRDDPNLPNYLRKKTETAKTGVAIRVLVDPAKIKKVVGIIKEYFNVNDVPVDETNLATFIVGKFESKLDEYAELEKKFQENDAYPGLDKLLNGSALLTGVLNCQKDAEALFGKIVELEDQLLDRQEDVQKVVDFFDNQVQLFDAALQLTNDVSSDVDYLEKVPEADAARQKILEIVQPEGEFDYKRIPELNEHIKTLRDAHDVLLEDKRRETLDLLDQCLNSVRETAKDDPKTAEVLTSADEYYANRKEEVPTVASLTLLDGIKAKALERQETFLNQIAQALVPAPEPTPKIDAPTETAAKKTVKKYNRQIVFPKRKLSSEEEIDAYVDAISKKLKSYLTDGVEILLD